MIPSLRKLLFEALYKNRYLYRFASTVPFAGQWRVWQRLVLTRLHGTIVLELGCGLGDLLADMLEAGYECRAIEHSPQMVTAARETADERSNTSSTADNGCRPLALALLHLLIGARADAMTADLCHLNRQIARSFELATTLCRNNGA